VLAVVVVVVAVSWNGDWIDCSHRVVAMHLALLPDFDKIRFVHSLEIHTHEVGRLVSVSAGSYPFIILWLNNNVPG
jgi:hypothetical protein